MVMKTGMMGFARSVAVLMWTVRVAQVVLIGSCCRRVIKHVVRQ